MNMYSHFRSSYIHYFKPQLSAQPLKKLKSLKLIPTFGLLAARFACGHPSRKFYLAAHSSRSRMFYSIISVTTPDPTVLPPSLMANLSPSSMAISVIRSISIVMLSPGMHISVPSGSFRSPVTSVVLK